MPNGSTVYKRACRALKVSLEKTVPGVALDQLGYVLDLENNLLPGITRSEIAEEFGAGAGNELDGKMLAPWSSSALAVNSFTPWRRSLDRLCLSGLTGFSSLAFEAKCPNGVSRIPPHLDLLLECGDEVVGVESKCLEYLKAKDRVKVSSRYLQLEDKKDFRNTSKWFKAIRHVSDFKHLDAYQLVKHYLGLALTYKARTITLVYIYWEPCKPEADPVFEAHRSELIKFADMVVEDKCCRFLAISYPDHWNELESITDPPDWLQAHILKLRDRYFVGINQ
jgi:hypothetical protein